MPGTPGLQHLIGGLEKEDGTGHISYEPENHALMTRLRAEKLAGIAEDIAELEVDDDDGAELLVLGWGSTYGAIKGAARRVRLRGKKVASRAPAPPQPAAAQHRRGRPLLPQGPDPGDQHRPARRRSSAPSSWSTRESYSKVEGLPIFAEELEEVITERL